MATTRRGAPATSRSPGSRGIKPGFSQPARALTACAGRIGRPGIESATCELHFGASDEPAKDRNGEPRTGCTHSGFVPRWPAAAICRRARASCSKVCSRSARARSRRPSSPRSTIWKRNCSASPNRAATTISNTAISKRCARSSVALSDVAPRYMMAIEDCLSAFRRSAGPTTRTKKSRVPAR